MVADSSQVMRAVPVARETLGGVINNSVNNNGGRLLGAALGSAVPGLPPGLVLARQLAAKS